MHDCIVSWVPSTNINKDNTVGAITRFNEYLGQCEGHKNVTVRYYLRMTMANHNSIEILLRKMMILEGFKIEWYQIKLKISVFYRCTPKSNQQTSSLDWNKSI